LKKGKRTGSCKLKLVDQGVSCEDQVRLFRQRNNISTHSEKLASATENATAGSASSFKYRTDAPFGKWKDTADLWVHGTWNYEWNDLYNKATINQATHSITLGAPHPEDGPITAPGAKFYVLNSMDALDAPGEFFIDRKEGKLYFIPPPGATAGAEAMVSIADSLVTVTGASNVNLVGLCLESCRKTGVKVSGSSNLNIQGNTVKNTGNHGIVITDGKHVTVDGNDVHHTGGRGIDCEAGDKDRLTPAGHLLKNNLVHHFERVCFTYNPGILLDGVGNTARNNEIWSAPHHGLEPEGNDQTVAFNVIHHTTCDAFDNGAIYWAPTDWTDYGYNFTYNLIHHTGYKQLACNADTSCMRVGIYCDDGAIGGIMYGNTIFNPKTQTINPGGKYNDVDTWAIFTNGGRDWTTRNNLALDTAFNYVGCAGLSWNDDMKQNGGDYYQQMKDQKITSPPYSTRYPKLAKLDEFYEKSGSGKCSTRASCPAAPFNVVIETNIAVNASATPKTESTPIVLPSKAESAGNGDPSCDGKGSDNGELFPDSKVTVNGNMLNEDPGFVSSDPRGTLDFRLNKGPSGWQAIPYDRIGPYGNDKPPNPPAPTPPTPAAPTPAPPVPTPPVPTPAPPPPAPTPGGGGSWTEHKGQSCDGNQIGKVLKGGTVEQCKAKCLTEAKCGCICVQHANGDCEMDSGHTSDSDKAYNAYTLKR
jgi:parallel beta-helix repeat protein